MECRRILVTLALVLGMPVLAWSGFTGTEVYLPSVGLGPGYQGSHWHTGIWICNPGSQDAQVVVQFLTRGTGNPSSPTAQLVVPAGETIRITDVLADLFAMSKGYGALRFLSDQKILVASRTYSQPAGAGEEMSTGQFFGAVPAAFAIGQGDDTSIVGGFQFTPMEAGAFRYNYGFVETTGNNVTVRVTAYNGNDPTTALGSKDYSVGGFAAVQENLAKLITHPNGDNIVLSFQVLSGSGKIIAFGTGVTNGSNDPSTFEMLFADSLLGGGGSSGGGLQSVAHDATLTGDGTTSAPLGVADGSLTAAKLSASGSSSGQVLTSDGISVHWQAPSSGGGLTLPYSGSITTDATGFVVRNNGKGRGIFAEAQNHDGLTGATHASGRSGVYGSSSHKEGYGVFGRNQGNAATGYLGGSDLHHFGNVMPVGVGGECSHCVGVLGISDTDAVFAGNTSSNTQVSLAGTDAAVWAFSPGSAPAGKFEGDVTIWGDLSVTGTKNFCIDHPLDPGGKYLYHAAVESDEVLDQYTGNVILDESGRATVTLPDWFEAINTDYRYQLTAIGGPAPGLHIASEIRDNRFEIAGGPPGLKVSWQVIARRNDLHLRKRPFVAERDKRGSVKGRYLDPGAYGQPQELAIDRLSRPPILKNVADLGSRRHNR